MPDREPRADVLNDHHFFMPMSLKQDVRNQPPQYKHLFRLDYDSWPGGDKALATSIPSDCCVCETQCDHRCLNRMMMIECFDVHGKKDIVCRLSDTCEGNCGNRLFQRKEYVKVTQFVEGEMGWGLKAAESLPKGSLVIEYLGEVINDDEMQSRMR